MCWWASGTAYLVSSVLPPPTVLMAGVFLALMLGAFVQVRRFLGGFSVVGFLGVATLMGCASDLLVSVACLGSTVQAVW